MALPKIFLKFLKRKEKGEFIKFPINPNLGAPPIGSPIKFGDKIIGKVKEIKGDYIIAHIDDTDTYDKYFKPQEPHSMGYKLIEEEDKE